MKTGKPPENLRIDPAVRSLPLNGFALGAIVAILDIIIIAGFFLLSYKRASELPSHPARIWKVTDFIFCFGLLYLMISTGKYRFARLTDPFSQISFILVNSLSIAALECAAIWSFGMYEGLHWPWGGPINTVSMGVIGICVTRLLIHRLLLASASHGFVSRRIAIVGAGALGERVMKALDERGEPWTEVFGIFDDRKVIRNGHGREAMGTIDDLILYARNHRVDEVLIALPWSAEERILYLLTRLKTMNTSVRLAPGGIGLNLLESNFGRLDGVPVYNVFGKPISGWGALLKRLEDLVFGSIILVIASPVMLICALAVVLDSRGPVLFRQERWGYNGRRIEVLKFRTMYVQTETDHVVVQAQHRDPRITRIGRFLRGSSLDELPQVFNVLRGDMSLVGPRPHASAHNEYFGGFIENYLRRHRIKPGITGLAQIKGYRGETDTVNKMQKRVEYDLQYIDNWSLSLDLKIIFLTPLLGLFHPNAR